VRRAGDDALRAGVEQRLGGALHRVAAGDQVVEQQHRHVLDIAGDQVRTADQPGAAALVDHREADRPQQPVLERLAPQLRALDAARIGRSHGQRLVADELGHDGIEHLVRRQVDRQAAERVLEGGDVVHLERDHLADADGLEELRDVAQRQRIVGLGLPVLARIGEVRHHRGDAPGAVLAQRRREHQQLEQLVVRAVLRAAMQAGDDVGIVPSRIDQRPQLVLAILEGAVLERSERFVELLGERASKAGIGVEREQQHGRSSVTCTGRASVRVDGRRLIVRKTTAIGRCISARCRCGAAVSARSATPSSPFAEPAQPSASRPPLTPVSPESGRRPSNAIR
jgi:hypothetical protein